MSANLTPRQQQILQLIRDSVDQEGRPPTRAEICRAFGFRSPNAAESHLRALAAKGVIALEEGRARGIRLMEALGLPLVGRVVAGVADEVTVKRLSRKGAIVELLPANPDFQPIVVDTRSTEVQIEGLAVG